MPELLTEVSGDTFQEEVLESSCPVVVDFWGPRCAPCLALMPQIDALAGEYQGKIKFCKVNSAKNRQLAAKLKVMALPTFLFYQEGALVAQLTGQEATVDNIVAQVKQLL